MEPNHFATTFSRDTYGPIFTLVDSYFHSIYAGDAAALRATFDPDCRLFADVNGTPSEKSVDEYVHGVAHRQSPRDLGEAFQMQVIGVETLGSIALVRTQQRMLGFNYFDYLTLRRRGAAWFIVSKVFTHVDTAHAGR